MTAALLAALLLAADDSSWWNRFGDPQLTALIDKARAHNLDLRLAQERIAEARALALGSRSKLLPTLDLNTNANRLRGGFQQGVVRIPTLSDSARPGSFIAPFETPIYSGSLESRWEIDFFGANRKALAAARADIRAEEERALDTAVIVAADVARAYFALRGLDRRLALARQTAAAQQDLLALTRTRAEAGLATQLDVERQATLLATTNATIPALEAERELEENRLAVLTADRGLQVPAAAPDLTIPAVGAGVDSTLLTRRPDVRASLADIEAATARYQVARTDLFPKISLTGLAGRQSTSVSGLSLGGGNFFSVGPSLQLPLFSGGRIKANIAANDARVLQAKTNHERELLAAFEETENALSSLRLQQEREQRLAEALAAARRSLDLAQDLQGAGLSDFLSVLDAQRELYAAEDSVAQARTAALTQAVALYRALAGGW